MTRQFMLNDDFRVTVEKENEWSRIGFVEQVYEWDISDNPISFAHYLSFYMKWDACCHINFGDKGADGYLHLCGDYSWVKHNQMMSDLFAWARKDIPMISETSA